MSCPSGRSAAATALLAVLLVACPKPRTVAVPDPGRADSVTARNRDLEQRVARLELQRLERDAQVDQLQGQLDAARREVVRAMAKLQTLASRAEAASAMAEAEVALQSLQLPAGQTPPGIVEAQQLLSQASDEFNKGNYGGALYLANQSKVATGTGRGALAGGSATTLRPGEVLFALPLNLQTTGRASIREGPGAAFHVVFALEAGAAVTGFSYADQWVRVTDDGGRSGWVYYRLVGRRADTAR